MNFSRNPALAFRLSSPIIVADLVDPDGLVRRNSPVPLIAFAQRFISLGDCTPLVSLPRIRVRPFLQGKLERASCSDFRAGMVTGSGYDGLHRFEITRDGKRIPPVEYR